MASLQTEDPSGCGAASPRQGRWDPDSLRPALSLGGVYVECMSIWKGLQLEGGKKPWVFNLSSQEWQKLGWDPRRGWEVVTVHHGPGKM